MKNVIKFTLGEAFLLAAVLVLVAMLTVVTCLTLDKVFPPGDGQSLNIALFGFSSGVKISSNGHGITALVLANLFIFFLARIATVLECRRKATSRNDPNA